MDRGNIAKSIYLQLGAVGGSEVAAETAKFNAESKRAEASAKSLAKEGGGAADFLKDKFDGLKDAFIGFVSVAGAKALFDFSADGARLIDLQSNVDRLGVSVAELSDVAGGTFSDEALGNAALLADKLGRSLGITAEQTRGLSQDAIRLADAFGIDLQDATRKLFTAVSGETGGLKEAFGLFVNGQAAIDKYAASVGKTADKLTEFEKRTAVANAIQEKLNGQLANAPIQTYQDRLDTLTVKVDNFTAALKRSAAELLLNPVVEAITGDYQGQFAVSTGNAGMDRLLQNLKESLSLQEQLRTGKFETSGFFDVSTTDDRIAAETKLNGLIRERESLRNLARQGYKDSRQAKIDAEGDVANEQVLFEIAKKRVKDREDAAKAAEKAAAEAAEARLPKTWEDLARRIFPDGTIQQMAALLKDAAEARARGDRALADELQAQVANYDAVIARFDKRQAEIESRRGSLLGEARSAGQMQASKLGGFGGLFGAVEQESARYSDVPRFDQAREAGILMPGEPEIAQSEAFREAINANIVTPLEIASDMTGQLAAGFADAAAAAILEGKGFEKGMQSVFKTLTRLALTKAIMEQAEALASLAWGNVPGFIAHEKASAAFLLIAGGAAIGTKAAGGSFGADEREEKSKAGSSQSAGARGVRNVNNNTANGSGSGPTVYNINVAYNGFTADQRGHEALIRMINGYGWRPGAPKIEPRAVGAA